MLRVIRVNTVGDLCDRTLDLLCCSEVALPPGSDGQHHGVDARLQGVQPRGTRRHLVRHPVRGLQLRQHVTV